MELYYLTAYFFIYGFLGWCVEVAFAAMKTGRFVNRGFLNGPICPVYGFGVASVIFCLNGTDAGLGVLYLTSALLVTLVELVTGYILDKLFHNKWWDYTGQPLNIGGYVCLPFSLIWGVFCVFIIRVFHPAVEMLVSLIPFPAGAVILAVCTAAILADLYVTASAILKLNRRLAAMERVAAELREFSDMMGENIYENVRDGMEMGGQLRTRVTDAADVERLKSRVAEVADVEQLKSRVASAADMERLKSRMADVADVERLKSRVADVADVVKLKSRMTEMKEAGRELGAEQAAGYEEWYRNQQLRLDELRERYESLLRNRGRITDRLVKAFPNMESRIYREALQELKRRFGLRKK